VSVNSEFVKYEDAADVLTPYATEFRYPGDIMDPTDEEMDQGIKNAEEILHYVISLLTDDLQKILS
jgi:hypothetical protein